MSVVAESLQVLSLQWVKAESRVTVACAGRQGLVCCPFKAHT